jgi:hypothetical protein
MTERQFDVTVFVGFMLVFAAATSFLGVWALTQFSRRRIYWQGWVSRDGKPTLYWMLFVGVVGIMIFGISFSIYIFIHTFA